MDSPQKKCAHCSIPCDKKCSRCAKVWYCGVEHQKLHRKTHKDNCFPAMALTDAQHGNYLASTRKILAGEVIFTEGPLILGPLACSQNKFPVCLGCCKVLPGQFGDGQHCCRKCSWPLCTQDCHQISYHLENECKIFQAQKVTPRDILLLPPSPPPLGAIYECVKVIRILLLKESDPEKFAKFLRLESHAELRRKSTDGVLQSVFTLRFIHGCCKMSLYSVDLINKLLGVVLANSIGATGSAIVPGSWCESGIFEKGSKLSHSCVPNTKNTPPTNNRVRRVFAATDIETNEMLTERYGDEETYWEGIVERRQSLYQIYHFWCSCPRCSDPTELGTYFSAIKCKRKNCSGFYLPANPLSTDGRKSIWKCNSEKCKNTEKYSKLSKTVSAIQDEIEKSMTVDDRLRIIAKHANVLVHENHFTLLKLRYDLLPILVDQFRADYGNVLACTKTIEFAGKCLEIANKLAPGLSLLRGILLYYLAQGTDKSTANSDLEPMSKMKALVESKPIREEAKRILELMPDGSQEFELYKTMVSQEMAFCKGVEMLESKSKMA